MSPLSVLLALWAAPALAQTVITGDAWVSGQLAAGTTVPAARLEVDASSTTLTVFQVSDVIGTPIITVDQKGRLGLGAAPTANADINGRGDAGVLGLQLQDGNLYPNTSSLQIVFGASGTTNLDHAIRTIHSTTTANNSIDFFLWSPAVSSTAVGTLQVLSVVSIASSPSSSEASFHVMPVSVSTAEVTVSNGATTGGGTVHRAIEFSHSSRELKSDIVYLSEEEERRAYAEIGALKHAKFRYKVWKKGKLERDRHQRLRRGLIYEDAPDDIKGPGQSLVLDARVDNAELALKELMRRLESLELQTGKPGGTP